MGACASVVEGCRLGFRLEINGIFLLLKISFYTGTKKMQASNSSLYAPAASCDPCEMNASCFCVQAMLFVTGSLVLCQNMPFGICQSLYKNGIISIVLIVENNVLLRLCVYMFDDSMISIC